MLLCCSPRCCRKRRGFIYVCSLKKRCLAACPALFHAATIAAYCFSSASKSSSISGASFISFLAARSRRYAACSSAGLLAASRSADLLSARPTSCAACWASWDREATFMARWTSLRSRPSCLDASLIPLSGLPLCLASGSHSSIVCAVNLMHIVKCFAV